MKKTFLLAAAAALLLLAGMVIHLNVTRPVHERSPRPSPGELETIPELNREVEKDILSLEIVDSLSGVAISPTGDLGLEVRGEPSWRVPFSSLDLPHLLAAAAGDPSGLALTYDAPSASHQAGVKWRMDLQQHSIAVSNTAVRLELDYFPSITITLQDPLTLSVPGVTVHAVVLPTAMPPSHDEGSHGHHSKSSLESLLGEFNAHSETPLASLAKATDSSGSAPLTLPESGFLLVSVTDRRFKTHWKVFPIHPGDNGQVHCVLTYRPYAAGVVRGLDGLPVAGLKVSATTHLNVDDYDFTQADRNRGFSLTGASVGDVQYTASRNSVRTDEQGAYMIHVPDGIGYHIAVKGKGFYEEEFFSPYDVDEQGLLKADFSVDFENTRGLGVTIRVVDLDGLPIGNADIDSAPINDQPWFRVYPQLRTDAEGWVSLPWFEDGTAGYLIVTSDTLSPAMNGQKVTLYDGQSIMIRDLSGADTSE